MNKRLILSSLLILILFSLYVNYSTYRSFIIQRVILSDHRSPIVYSFDTLDSILPAIPNTSITAMPLDVFRVNYLLYEGRLDETRFYIERAKKINPYTHVGDFLDGKLYYYRGMYDSAYVHLKAAFQGWPKNLDHYNSYVDVLEELKDSTSLIKAYNFLDNSLKQKPEYFERFYKSFNAIKLSYLIIDYPDAIPMNQDSLIGSWQRVYNFPNNQIVRDTTVLYNFMENTFSNKAKEIFAYRLKKDSLSFYFTNNLKKPISSFKTKYSNEHKTLIFEDMPIGQNKFQTQYFRKLD